MYKPGDEHRRTSGSMAVEAQHQALTHHPLRGRPPAWTPRRVMMPSSATGRNNRISAANHLNSGRPLTTKPPSAPGSLGRQATAGIGNPSVALQYREKPLRWANHLASGRCQRTTSQTARSQGAGLIPALLRVVAVAALDFLAEPRNTATLALQVQRCRGDALGARWWRRHKPIDRWAAWVGFIGRSLEPPTPAGIRAGT